MPIGFADLLQTNSQYVNGLNKGIVSTDDSFGGIRSKIDDWTDLHLSTKTNDNNVTYYTFQDDGTNAAPGQFKEYSTMFYVADGRALVEDSSAGANFIRLDGSGNFVSSGGTKYVVPSSGSAEPEFWVLDDATQTGGSGIGTDKLPKFTITGTQGSDSSTAIPAGYQKLRVLANAASIVLDWARKKNILAEEELADLIITDMPLGDTITKELYKVEEEEATIEATH